MQSEKWKKLNGEAKKICFGMEMLSSLRKKDPMLVAFSISTLRELISLLARSRLSVNTIYLEL